MVIFLALSTEGCGPANKTVKDFQKQQTPFIRQLKPVMMRIQYLIQKCYNKNRKAASLGELRGEMIVRWQVTTGGQSHNVEVLKDTLASSLVTQCIKDAIQQASFPKHSQFEPITLQNSFAFGLEKHD